MKRATVALAALVAAGAWGVNGASAETYTFCGITNNNSESTAAGEAQLRVDVTDAGAGQVLFTFYHVGDVQMSITDIYFDDGTLLGIASIDDSDPGVEFSLGADPGNLPGGNSVGFEATAGMTADSDPPAQPNGVNPGETVGILFNLQAGKTFADVLAALEIGFGEGGLVIGIHVQGFDGGWSEAFITCEPPRTVPAPAGVALGLAGLAPVVTRRRR